MSSFIYKNISLYRLAMQMLYGGKYYRRYDPVIRFLKEKKPKSVLELCFGDTVIAGVCKKQNTNWKGMDLNLNFVNRAIKKGFTAEQRDIHPNEEFPKAEGVLMMGSLYHFGWNAEALIINALKNSNWFLINEPINSYAQHKKLGKFAAKLSDTGKGAEVFRFDSKTLEQLAQKICQNNLYSYTIIHLDKKEMTLLIEKK